MKRIILLIVILIPLLVSSQNYPLVKNGAIWRETSVYLINPPSVFGMHSYQYLMNGDTVLNNQLYKKVFSTDYDSLPLNPVYIGAIREDSLSKVYFKGNSFFWANIIVLPFDTSELLLYDFALNPNDTFVVNGANYDSVNVVDYIDSVSIGGDWRKRIHFKFNGLSQRDWIEGIGSLKGLFFPFLFEFENYNQLICYEDSSIYWTHPNVTYNCLTVGLDEPEHLINSKKIELYPNPANSIVYFNVPYSGSQIETIVIRDLVGRVIQFVSKSNIERSQIQISELNQGTYIAEFRVDNGSKIVKKFIKHNR